MDKGQRERESLRVQQAELCLAAHNRREPKRDAFNIFSVVEPYREYFISDREAFKIKTKSDNPEKQLMELVRNLFCKYRVGNNLSKIWLRKLPKTGPDRFFGNTGHEYIVPVDPIQWFFCAAQGGSLYKEHTKKYLTKMETHVLLTCPHDLTFDQTLIFAMAKTFAKRDGDALRLAHSKLHKIGFSDFMKTVIYFFAKNPAGSLEEVNDLVDYILSRHQAYEKWSLAGRTIDSIRQKCKDWHFELRRVKALGNYTWEGAPLPNTMIQTGSEAHPMCWHFIQLKTSKLLAEEGNKLRHCVYSYRDHCISGSTSIWSLALDDCGIISKKVTLELDNSGDIVQARGLANRTIRLEERNAINLWARSNGLRIAC